MSGKIENKKKKKIKKRKKRKKKKRVKREKESVLSRSWEIKLTLLDKVHSDPELKLLDKVHSDPEFYQNLHQFSKLDRL